VANAPGVQISGALGNVVLVDHGRSVEDDFGRRAQADATLGVVPRPTLKRAPAEASRRACDHVEREDVPVRFRPRLVEGPVTHGFDLAELLKQPLLLGGEPNDEWVPASALLERDPWEALPLIGSLVGTFDGKPTSWKPQRDLLASDADDAHFVVETEEDGSAFLRFGDGTHGRRPQAGTGTGPTSKPGAEFEATYRVGNGAAGNVGAESIAHVVTTMTGVFAKVTNPLPARGGVDPEPLEAARRDAPEAFRTQERAVTAADYAAAAERRPEVQRAAATFRWTGSWYTVFVTADRVGGAPVDAPFERRLRRHLERFRMAGYDLEVDGPRFVPLDIALHVCVLPGYFRSEVLRAVLAELGTAVLPDGRLGLFHPDNFSFDQAVYLSRVIAAAQAVEGVEAVSATRFTRLADPSDAGIEEGFLRMGRLEIAQLANDPSFRERGRLLVSAGGGK
jgi:predicted phage baseplate assembly protein